MPKPTLNLRLEPEILQELQRLHPGYGETARIVRLLVQHYIWARKATSTQGAIAGAVLGVIRG